MTKLVKHNNIQQLMHGLSISVAKELRDSLKNKNFVSLSVPGGTTPAPFFDLLCKESLDWSRVRILLSDERYVPETNNRSNTTLVKRHLMQSNAAKAQLIRFYSPDQTEDEFVRQSIAYMNTFMPIDVSVLGMGLDMHTASLFPDSAELADALSTSDSLYVVRPASQPEARITLSGRVLAQAVKTYILIIGQEKLAAYNLAMSKTSAMLAPIRTVFGNQTKVFWADIDN
ncbi:MAG: 6-phosphogluconolactonase [Amylibacter sp.]|jgi:6-phosphogluconolactonase|tara:strand:+ start:66339 stop:67025 length:687 start_codon:yes stop_codon:yes gene_type:complete